MSQKSAFLQYLISYSDFFLEIREKHGIKSTCQDDLGVLITGEVNQLGVNIMRPTTDVI